MKQLGPNVFRRFLPLVSKYYFLNSINSRFGHLFSTIRRNTECIAYYYILLAVKKISPLIRLNVVNKRRLIAEQTFDR